MAEENLGKAVLRIEVDIPNFEKDLNKARTLVEKQKPLNFKLDISDSKQQFLKLEASARTLERQLKNLLATPLNINSKNLEKLGADALTAGTAINQFTRQVLNGEKPIANSIAAIQQQGNAFRTLAANVKIGSTEFNNFAQAAIKASQKELFAGFQEISAAQKLFTLGGAGGVDTFKGTEQLLAYSRSIGKTPAAIQLYISALQQALNVTSTADSNFGRLTLEIQNQAAALERAGNAATRYNQIFNLGAQPKALPPGRGPSQFVFTGEETPEERRARERSERRAGKIQGIQQYASTGGLDPLQGFNLRLARPDLEAIKAQTTGERQLTRERVEAAKAARQAAAAERQALQQARRERVRSAKEFTGQVSGALSSAVIGGAFPLLFGQGGGAAGGGLVGGLLGGALGGGGGFAGSLVGTVIGSTADKFGELAKALEDPVKNLDLLIQNANLSGKGVEQLAKTLVETGRTAEAEALIRRDLARTIDPVSSAVVAAANDKYARSLADITEKLGLLLAGPATQFTSWLTDIINRVSGLPTGEAPTSRSALAVRGQGAALGIGGVGLAAVGLATGNIPAIAGGLGLAGLGQGQIAAAEFQEQQIAASASIEAAQAKIAVVEARRVSLQRQILEATRAGQTGAARDLQLADDLAAVDAARAKARADALAIPGTLSPAQLQAFKALLDSLDLQKEKIQTNFALEKRNREAVRTLSQAQFNIDSAAVSRQIQNVTALGRVEQGAAREALSLRQQVADEIATSRDRESTIAAQIQAATVRGGGELTQELRDLYNQQTLAAQNTELALKRGALSLRDATARLRDDLRNAVLSFTSIRSDPQGLNRFLNPQQQSQRALQDFQLLLPAFREAQARFTGLTGQRAPEFSGPTAAVNASVRDFIAATNREFDASNTLAQTQQALNDTTTALVSVNTQLAQVTQALADKNWDVNLVLPNGSKVPYPDQQNALFPIS